MKRKHIRMMFIYMEITKHHLLNLTIFMGIPTV